MENPPSFLIFKPLLKGEVSKSDCDFDGEVIKRHILCRKKVNFSRNFPNAFGVVLVTSPSASVSRIRLFLRKREPPRHIRDTPPDRGNFLSGEALTRPQCGRGGAKLHRQTGNQNKPKDGGTPPSFNICEITSQHTSIQTLLPFQSRACLF